MATTQQLILSSSNYASVRQVTTPYIVNGFSFAALPDQDHRGYNTQLVRLFGQDWVRVEARQGDNNTNEMLVERCGLDGFANRHNEDFNITFEVIPGMNCIADSSGEWWNFFEMHAFKHPDFPSEFETAGPLTFFNEWSNGGSQPRFRIYRKYMTVDPPTNAGDYTQELLYDQNNMVQGNKYRFRVETRRHHTDGHIRVWMSVNDGAETQIVNYSGQFGYGMRRETYAQLRIYRNARLEQQVCHFRIVDINTGPSAAFSPFQLGNKGAKVYTWWDADTPALFTTSGEQVSSWRDIWRGYNVSQASSSLQPLLKSTGWNGSPAVELDGVDDLLTLEGVPAGIPTGATPCEWWLLMNDFALASGDTTQRIFMSQGDGGNTRRMIQRLPSGANNRIRTSTGTAGGEVGNHYALANFPNARAVVRAVWDGTNTTLQFNNNAVSSVAAVPTIGNQRFRFGASPGTTPSLFAQGQIKAAVMTQLLDTTEADNMWTWGMGRRAL